jgi:hypothetical protein
MKKQNTEILLQYSDKYIAYIDDIEQIIASGNTMIEVDKQLKKNNVKQATITYIPPVDKSFSPLCQ